MTEAIAALIGASIGAIAGLTGGGFAALASLRASQVAVRAPLSSTLHDLTKALIKLITSTGDEEKKQRLLEFEIIWNAFYIQQRILCPSVKIEKLIELLYQLEKSQIPMETSAMFAGQFMDKVARMIATHSYHMFRWRAIRAERKIIEKWLSSPQAESMNEKLREKLLMIAEGHNTQD